MPRIGKEMKPKQDFTHNSSFKHDWPFLQWNSCVTRSTLYSERERVQEVLYCRIWHLDTTHSQYYLVCGWWCVRCSHGCAQGGRGHSTHTTWWFVMNGAGGNNLSWRHWSHCVQRFFPWCLVLLGVTQAEEGVVCMFVCMGRSATLVRVKNKRVERLQATPMTE